MNDEQKLEANLAAVRMLGYVPWHENGAVFYRMPVTAVDPGVAEIFPDGIPAHFDMFTRAQDTLAVIEHLLGFGIGICGAGTDGKGDNQCFIWSERHQTHIGDLFTDYRVAAGTAVLSVMSRA